MRENRTCGSEGGEAQSLPYPYLLLDFDVDVEGGGVGGVVVVGYG